MLRANWPLKTVVTLVTLTSLHCGCLRSRKWAEARGTRGAQQVPGRGRGGGRRDATGRP